MNKYPYSVIELSNKLRLLHVPSTTAESVAVTIIGKVGRRAELPAEVGSAHFLEHLLFDGTKRYPTETALAKFLGDSGGRCNGSTGSETVDYWVKTIVDKTEVAFDYLSDIFFNSLLEEIDKERKVIA